MKELGQGILEMHKKKIIFRRFHKFHRGRVPVPSIVTPTVLAFTHTLADPRGPDSCFLTRPLQMYPYKKIVKEIVPSSDLPPPFALFSISDPFPKFPHPSLV